MTKQANLVSLYITAEIYNEEESVYYDICDLTPEWKEFEVPLSGGCPSSSIQMYANSAEILLDDITIESKGIPAPIPTGCSEFNGSSFTATWTAVEGAASYIFEVFEITPYGDRKTDLVMVKVANKTFKVTF